eukprot:jgi/Mesen1/3920/ME000209S02934
MDWISALSFPGAGLGRAPLSLLFSEAADDSLLHRDHQRSAASGRSYACHLSATGVKMSLVSAVHDRLGIGLKLRGMRPHLPGDPSLEGSPITRHLGGGAEEVAYHQSRGGGPLGSRRMLALATSLLRSMQNWRRPGDLAKWLHARRRRRCTDVILVLNALVFGASMASNGALLQYGAKVNRLISQGQVWRLVTPALLHANLMHLVINGMSLNAVGPQIEMLSGRSRFLAVYCTSALTASFLSYRCTVAPAVGASGAIYGLVGALWVFVMRHQKLLRGTGNGGWAAGQLKSVTTNIAFSLALGVVSRGMDNWGHVGARSRSNCSATCSGTPSFPSKTLLVGGLAGGVVVSYLLGPALRETAGGVVADVPPLARLFPRSK